MYDRHQMSELRVEGLACGCGRAVLMWSRYKTTATSENKSLKLAAQPTSLRRCLDCEHWMRSTGPDHRICNSCKREHVRGPLCPGSRVTA